MKLFRFLAGAALGAGTALMLAPRSGKETREMVAGKINDMTDGGAQETIDRARETVAQGKATVADAYEQARAQAAPVAEDIKIRINEARDRLADQIVKGQHNTKTVDADVCDAQEDACAQQAQEKIEDIAADVAAKAQESVQAQASENVQESENA